MLSTAFCVALLAATAEVTGAWTTAQSPAALSDLADAALDAALEFLLRKVYWLSGVLGEGQPVWIADPRDAQYLNTTEADLLRMAGDEAGHGLMLLGGEFAAATPALMDRSADYQEALEAALDDPDEACAWARKSLAVAQAKAAQKPPKRKR